MAVNGPAALVHLWIEKLLYFGIFIQVLVFHYNLAENFLRRYPLLSRSSVTARRLPHWSVWFWREIKLLQLALLLLCTALRAGDALLDQTLHRLLILSVISNMTDRRMPAKADAKKFRFNREESPEIEAGVDPAGVGAGSSTGQQAKSSSRRSAAKKNPAGAGSAATGEAKVSVEVILGTAANLQSKMFPFTAWVFKQFLGFVFIHFQFIAHQCYYHHFLSFPLISQANRRSHRRSEDLRREIGEFQLELAMLCIVQRPCVLCNTVLYGRGSIVELLLVSLEPGECTQSAYTVETCFELLKLEGCDRIAWFAVWNDIGSTVKGRPASLATGGFQGSVGTKVKDGSNYVLERGFVLLGLREWSCPSSVCNTVRDDGGSIVRGRFVLLNLGGYDGIVRDTERCGGGSMIKGYFDPIGPWRCDGIVGTIVQGGSIVRDDACSIVGGHSALLGLRDGCNTLRDGGGSIFERCFVLFDSPGGCDGASPCTDLLCQTSGKILNTIGTMVKRVLIGNTDPFALGPGSPARQGARHE
jgi:hypothetical protein